MPDKHPPRPRLTLNVGITGHRANVLPPEVIKDLRSCLDMVLGRLRDAVEKLHASEDLLFTGQPPVLRLHTPLATGTDQLAAESAHELGYSVRALLPFPPAEYSNDFAGDAENRDFKSHLGAADEVFALPGERTQEVVAYVMVGKAVMAAADILIAVWDGQEGNGLGGTAHVVDMAIRAAVPVVHIEIDREAKAISGVRLLSGGDAREPEARPLANAEDFANLVIDTLAPHDVIERELIKAFYAEREVLTNWRIEYPLLLAIMGIKRLPVRPWQQSPISDEAPDGSDSHQSAYAWANFLAIRNAQLFRSGHFTNYGLSVLAVFIGLGGLLVPYLKPLLVAGELGVIGLLMLNTRAGRKGEWHRRWLQYRHLAESLRPLAYLKRTSMAPPPFRNDYVEGANHRTTRADWTRWYTSAIWREMASPTGIVTKARIASLASAIVEEQVRPQAAYHLTNAKRMHRLDHRLHEFGNITLGAVIAACLLYLMGSVFMTHAVKALSMPFVVVTVGLPTLGAALFGLRGHGEHLLAASRSINTVAALNANADRLTSAAGLDQLASEMENTAAIMLADLNEWTVSYSERSLEIPG